MVHKISASRKVNAIFNDVAVVFLPGKQDYTSELMGVWSEQRRASTKLIYRVKDEAAIPFISFG